MIKRGTKIVAHNSSTPDDIMWLRSFQLAQSHTLEEPSASVRTATLGFMPGLWRTINNKSAFAEAVAAASGSGSCSDDTSGGGGGPHSCSVSPAAFHPET